MKRTLSLAVSLALLCTLAVPAGAEPAAEDGLTVHWLEAGPGYEIFRWPGENRALSVRDGKYGLIDLEGKTLYPCELDMVVPSGSGGYLANKDGGWSGMGTLGNLYDESFSYPTMEMARDGRTVRVDVQEGKGCGVVDLEGNTVVPYRYWNGKDYTEGLAAVEDTNGLWGYIDLEGHTVIPHRYVFAEPFQDGLAPVAAGIGRWGLVDAAGTEVVPCVYFAVGYAGEGMYWLRYTENFREKLAFANDRGQIVTEGWDYLTGNKGQMEGGSFSGGVAQVWRDGNAQWIDRQGKVVQAPAQPEDNTYHEGLRRMERDGKWGFADEAGELVTNYIYDGVGDFDQGVAAVRVGDRWGFLENPLNQRREAELSITWLEGYHSLYREDGFLYGFKNGRWGVLEYNGDFHPWPEGVSTPYSMSKNGPYMAEKDGKLGAVDRRGNVLVPFTHERGEDTAFERVAALAAREGDLARYGVAIEVRNGLFGMVDRDGNVVAEFRYERISPFDEDGLATFRIRNAEGNLPMGLINRAGKEIVPVGGPYFSFKLAGEGMVAVRSEQNRMGYLNAAGELVAPCIYRAYDGWHSSELVNCDFAYGLAAVQRDDTGLWGYIDTTGHEVIPCRYALARNFDESGIAEVEEVGGGSHLIDRQGNDAGPAPEAGAIGCSEGLRVTHPNEKYGYEDAHGNTVVPPLYYETEDFRDGYALVLKDGLYGLLKNPLKADVVSDWAKAEVDRAKDLGLVPAREARYYTYDVTRLQFTELAVNLVEKTTGQAIEPEEPGRFTDTDDLAARKAAAAGIVNGTGDGSTFSPDAPITREQLAAMLCRAMGWTEAGAADLTSYDDGAAVAPWAREAVAALVERGILQGADNALSPQDYTTVEQAILLVLRSYEQGGIEG